MQCRIVGIGNRFVYLESVKYGSEHVLPKSDWESRKTPRVGAVVEIVWDVKKERFVLN